MLLVLALLPEQLLELSLDAEMVLSVVGHGGCSGSVPRGSGGRILGSRPGSISLGLPWR